MRRPQRLPSETSLGRGSAGEEEVDQVKDVGDVDLSVGVHVAGRVDQNVADVRRSLLREPEVARAGGDGARLAVGPRDRGLPDDVAVSPHAADLVAGELPGPKITV